MHYLLHNITAILEGHNSCLGGISSDLEGYGPDMPHCGAGLIKGLYLQFTQVQQNLTFVAYIFLFKCSRTRHQYFASNLGPSGMSVAILKKQNPYF